MQGTQGNGQYNNNINNINQQIPIGLQQQQNNSQFFMNQSYSSSQQVYYSQYGGGGPLQSPLVPQNLQMPAQTNQMQPQMMNNMGNINNMGNMNMMQQFPQMMNGMGNMNMMQPQMMNGMGNMNMVQPQMINNNSNSNINSGGMVIPNNTGSGGMLSNQVLQPTQKSISSGNNTSPAQSQNQQQQQQQQQSTVLSGDKNNRWFPTKDNDPFISIEQEKKKPQYKAADWSDQDKYREIRDSLNSPPNQQQNGMMINSAGNGMLGMQHPQQYNNHLSGINSMPNLQQPQPQQPQMTHQQMQQILMANPQLQQQMMMNPQLQQQIMLNPQLLNHFSQINQMNQMNVLNQLNNLNNNVNGMVMNNNMGQFNNNNNGNNIHQISGNNMGQFNNMNQMVDQRTLSGGSMQLNNNNNNNIYSSPTSSIDNSNMLLMQQHLQQNNSAHSQQSPTSSLSSPSPTTSLSPPKQQSVVSLSPSSSIGNNSQINNLISSLPSSNPSPSSSLTKQQIIPSTQSLPKPETSIPPIPQHLAGNNAFADPRKHSSAALLNSIIPNQQQPATTTTTQQQTSSSSSTQQQKNQYGSFSLVQQQNSSSSSFQQQSIQPQPQSPPPPQQQQPPLFTFEQQTVDYNPIQSPISSQNNNININNNLNNNNTTFIPSPNVVYQAPPNFNNNNNNGFISPTSSFSEEDYKRQIEEKIRKELKQEYEQKQKEELEKLKASQIPSPQHTTTTTTSSSSQQQSTTTTSTTSPDYIFPDLFADFQPQKQQTPSTTSSSSTTTTTSSSFGNNNLNIPTNGINSNNEPSPVISRKSATQTEKDKLKKDLENIHLNKDLKPTGFLKTPTKVTTTTSSTSSSTTTTSSNSSSTTVEVQCPICQQRFQNERILSVHLDDWHPSMRGIYSPVVNSNNNSPIIDFSDIETSKPSSTTTTTKGRSKTVSFQSVPIENKKSTSSEELKKKIQSLGSTPIKSTTSTTSSSSSTNHSSTTTTISSIPPSIKNRVNDQSDINLLSASFEKVFIPMKPKIVYTTDSAALVIQTNYRRYKARKEFKREQLRHKAVSELVSTEKSYVEGLEKLIENFATPLMGLADNDCPLIERSDIEFIFGKHKIILQFNRELYLRLAERTEHWNVVTKIGDVLIDIITQDEFKSIYNSFTLSYQNILSTIEKLSTSKNSFKTFLRNSERSLWSGGNGITGNNLQSLLITPVQRITRYLLLLKEIIKFTKPSHPDYDSLCISLFEMQDICTDVNENQRKEENEKIRIQTLTNIANRFDPKPKELNLVVDGRYLIKEGSISIYDSDSEKRKERAYFLFNDILLIVKKSKSKILFKNLIYLQNIKIRNIPDNQKCYGTTSKYSFEIQGHGNHVILFFSDSQEDKDSIIQQLETLLLR